MTRSFTVLATTVRDGVLGGDHGNVIATGMPGIFFDAHSNPAQAVARGGR